MQWTPEKRPPLPDRHQLFAQLRDVIRQVRVMYTEMPFERVADILRSLEQMAEKQDALEEFYRDEELRELVADLRMYPFTIRTWVMFYRDKELED